MEMSERCEGCCALAQHAARQCRVLSDEHAIRGAGDQDPIRIPDEQNAIRIATHHDADRILDGDAPDIPADGHVRLRLVHQHRDHAARSDHYVCIDCGMRWRRAVPDADADAAVTWSMHGLTPLQQHLARIEGSLATSRHGW